MRYLVIIATGCLFISSAHALDQQNIIAPFFSSVMIRTQRTDGGLGHGSGVVITQHHVLTNCHVLRESSQIWISHGREIYRIDTMQADMWHDLCLLHAPSLPLKPVQLGESNKVKKGDQVIAIGHSNGTASPIVSVGSIKSLHSLDSGNLIRSTARFSVGASGSGLYNEAGQLIGINTFKTAGRQAYYYALPIEWLTQLQTRPIQHLAGQPIHLHGETLWEASAQAKLYFLMVAMPELQEDWQVLLTIAMQWIVDEPENSDAWHKLGLAQEHLTKTEQAISSYQRALVLNPGNTDSMFRLGLIAARQRKYDEVRTLEQSLSRVSEKLAMEFRKAVACQDNCDNKLSHPSLPH